MWCGQKYVHLCAKVNGLLFIKMFSSYVVFGSADEKEDDEHHPVSISFPDIYSAGSTTSAKPLTG
jgi:hypothetical protein